jgi:hypothetical protein
MKYGKYGTDLLLLLKSAYIHYIVALPLMLELFTGAYSCLDSSKNTIF